MLTRCVVRGALALAALLLTALPAPAQDFAIPADSPDREVSADPIIQRMERLAAEGRLPSYEDLRLPGEEGAVAVERYLAAMPVMREDMATTDLVFADVPDDLPFARMTLEELIAVALRENYDLINSRRNLLIAESETTSAEAFFIPFIDLVGGANYSRTTNDDAASIANPGTLTTSRSTTISSNAGIEAGQNLPTGGRITADLSESARWSRTAFDDGGASSNRTWDASSSIRLSQPLLRGSGLLTGAGFDIGTADLRRARLSELNARLGDSITERDIILSVIRQYFTILRLRQQLLVNRDAIRVRYQFLNETRVRYDVGRVAESEILRAEIQFLREIESAISSQQSLDNARENLLLVLGLPLDTPISLIDVTTYLVLRGRTEIPPIEEATEFARNYREELMRSDISIALSEISRQLGRNDLLPDVDVDVGYRRFDSGNSIGDANEFGREGFDAGLGLRIPLQNIQRRESVRRSEIRLEQQRLSHEDLERRLTREVIQAHRSVLTTEARLTVLSKQVEQARRNLQLINSSFEVGYATVTDVRLAQDDLFNAELTYSNAILSYQISIAELYVAMGLPLL